MAKKRIFARITDMLLLIAVLITSISQTAFAANNVKKEPKLVEKFEIETGTYYSYESIEDGKAWMSIVFIPNDERDVTFSAASIALNDEDSRIGDDGIIYSICLSPASDKMARDYLEEGFSRINEAKRINVSSFTDTGENQDSSMRDSVEADLKEEMRRIYGKEYSRVVYSNYTYPQVNVIRVREILTFNVRLKDTKIFSASTPLAIVALFVYKATTLSVLLSFISVALDVTGEVLGSRKKVEAYVVEGNFGRCTTINNSSTVYTTTDKIYKHVGVNEKYNAVRAYLQEGKYKLSYAPSSSYYNNYRAQTDDAYVIYQNTH